jgi:hypothetical protein
MMLVQTKQRITSGFVQGWQDVVLPHRQQYLNFSSGLDGTLIGFCLLPSTSVILLGGGYRAGR